MKPRADEIDAIIGKNVHLTRTARGIRRAAVAKAIGVTVQQLQKYETGGARISAARLVRIAEALHVPVAELFAGTSPRNLAMHRSSTNAKAHALLRLMSERQQKLAIDALTIIAGTTP
jgi:transcriptional regulator with XRE-family HTH domain